MAFISGIKTSKFTIPVIAETTVNRVFSNTVFGKSSDYITPYEINALFTNNRAIINASKAFSAADFPGMDSDTAPINVDSNFFRFVLNRVNIQIGYGTVYYYSTEYARTNRIIKWEFIDTNDGWNTYTKDGNGSTFSFPDYSPSQYNVWGSCIYALKVTDTQGNVAYCVNTFDYNKLDTSDTPTLYTMNGCAINATKLKSAYDVELIISSESEEYGDESEDGGYGDGGSLPDFDHSSDIISVPDDPSVSTGTVGFMNVYKVSSGALSGLGQYLFPTIDPTQWTDVTQVLRGIAGIFAYRDSIQYVVDLHAIPVNPAAGASKYIKLGQLETDISQPTCASDYCNVDCGSVSIPERFRNFLDYTEVTCKIFIPFVGFVELQPEYWASGTIQLKYKFNVIDGSFMAYLISTSSKSNLTNTVIGQYSGSACLHLPVVAASYGAIVSGLISGSSTMAAAAQKKTAAGQISGVAEGGLTAGNFQPKMQQSNSYNCSAAYLGCRRPYLLIEYPVQSFSPKYPHDKGLPANVTRTIGSMANTGYTVIEDIDLSGIGATQAELDELRSILAGGVYL